MSAMLLPNHFSNLSVYNFFTPTPVYSLPAKVPLQAILQIASLSSLTYSPNAEKTILTSTFHAEFLEELHQKASSSL
jgi:hypothetical protein